MILQHPLSAAGATWKCSIYYTLVDNMHHQLYMRKLVLVCVCVCVFVRGTNGFIVTVQCSGMPSFLLDDYCGDDKLLLYGGMFRFCFDLLVAE